MANLDRKIDRDSADGTPQDRTGVSRVKKQDEVQERLGFGLRSMYRSVLEEPLPDDMMALLDQLDDNDHDDTDMQPGSNSGE